jgi:glycosyltransferase involved in cell wall biosynthesis
MATQIDPVRLRGTELSGSLGQSMSHRVALLAPVPLGSPRGNAVTVARIALGLATRDVDVRVWDAGADGLLEEATRTVPAVVHAFHAYRAGPLGQMLARACHAPLVVTLTGTDVSADLIHPVHGPAVRGVLLGAAAVTAFHDSIVSEVVAALPALAGRVTVVPQSVRLMPPKPGEPAPPVGGDPCIVFPAGIRPVKRPCLPLLALDGLLRQHPGTRLWYAGPALDPEETRRLRQQLARRPWARYLGAVPHHGMPALLTVADIVLNCSISEGGMANAVLEALALGRAVLASDIPGNRSLVEDGVTGLLFGSEAELADKARRLAGDGGLRRRLGEAGQRLVELRFTPTAETEGYLAVYARVAGGGLA